MLRLKLTKNEWKLFYLITILFTIFFASSFYKSYIKQKEYDQELAQYYENIRSQDLYNESYDLPSQLTNSILPLYAQLLRQDDQHKDKDFAQLLLSNYDDLNSDKIQWFNQYIQNLQVYYANQYSKVHYYLKKDKLVLTNQDEIKTYLTNHDNIDTKNTWYMAMHFDNQGIISNWKTTSKKYPASEVSYRLNQSLFDALMNDASMTSGNVYQLITFSELDVVYEVTNGSIQEPYDAYSSFSNTSVTPYINAPLFILLSLLLIIYGYFYKHTQSKWIQYTKIIPFDILTISLFILFIISLHFMDNVLYDILRRYFLQLTYIFSFLCNLFFTIIFSYLFFFLSFITGVKINDLCRHKHSIAYWKQQLFCIICFKYVYHFIDHTLNFLSKYHKTNLLIYTICISFYILLIIIFSLFALNSFIFIILFILPCNTIFIYIFLTILNKRKRKQIHYLNQLTQHIVKENFTSIPPMHCGELEPIKSDLLKIHEQIETAILEERRSQQMKTELITNVSHDLKTPLTSIISYIDLLKKNELSEEERIQYLDVLTTSSNRLKHLIEDLFDISKANSGNIQLDYMELDIVALMKQVQLECDTMMKERGLEIRNTFSDNKILWTLDPQKTFRIFHNLLSNISKYALEHTRVYISIHDYQSVLEISMKNISKEEITYSAEELMERFVREDHSRNSEGSGLGLAIVKSFTELQKGSITITTDGDLFKVNLRFQK